jgi:dolichyl-phosphate-mannose--protein O-mannosyl transferase
MDENRKFYTTNIGELLKYLDFNTITLTLRFWSAFFSSISVFIFYLIGKKIFKSSKFAFIFSLLIILVFLISGIFFKSLKNPSFRGIFY